MRNVRDRTLLSACGVAAALLVGACTGAGTLHKIGGLPFSKSALDRS